MSNLIEGLLVVVAIGITVATIVFVSAVARR
jgi:hypothetical protein